MQIDDSRKPKGASPRIGPRPDTTEDQPETRDRTSVVHACDQVHLSPHGREYQKARQALSMLPDIDADKVREIKGRLQTGRYRIDADKIAEKMIRETLTGED